MGMSGPGEVVDDFETKLFARINQIRGKYPKTALSHYDFPLDNLTKLQFSSAGALKVDVTAVVADSVNIASPLNSDGSLEVEDPRMNFTSGRLEVDVTATVADKVYIYGSDYASTPTNYQVKTDSSGNLYNNVQAIVKTTVSPVTFNGTTSATPGAGTALSVTSIICTHFQFSNHGSEVIYVGNSSSIEGQPVFPNGVYWWDAEVDQNTDLEDWYTISGSASVAYSVSYQ